MQEIFNSLLDQSATQWIALITGLCYVILAAYEKPLCWPFGIISSSLIAVDDFAVFQLYSDGVLQIFYVFFGFLGLYFWIFRNEPGKTLPVTSLTWTKHVIPVAACFLISIPLAMLLNTYTNAAYSYLDAVTTLLSLWATWLLVRKVRDNWLYWMAIDAVYIVMFWVRGGELIAILYTLYMLVAIWGYIQWRKSSPQSAVRSLQSVADETTE